MVASEAFEMPVSCKECIFHSNYGMCQLSGYFEDEDYTNTERSVDCPLVEAIPKDQYEARLKADLVAILRLFEQHDDTDLIEVKYVRLTIQQKINSLKGDQEGEE